MSISENNPLLSNQKGMIGGMLVIRRVKGNTVISLRPRKRAEPTPHQLETKKRFLQAVAYSRRQMQVPGIKALYTTAVRGKIPNAYTAALRDFLNAPIVHSIKAEEYQGRIGDTILIYATDDFEVTGVTVAIMDASGTLRETGEAERTDFDRDGWEYKSTVENDAARSCKIVVTAMDRPGHTGVMEVFL